MGLNIAEIVPRTGLEFSQLNGKVVAVDAFNVIYQFLSSIRQPDGTPLMDSSKRVTSHLSGLFYRNISLMQEGIRLVYVFDGKTPDLKNKTHEIRQEAKDSAREKYERARQEEDVELMGRYSKGMVRLTSEMIEESKQLLEALGIAVIQAPSEGESEASYLTRKGRVYATASQDYDSLLFGTPRLIQNLTLARKRKTGTGFIYISPEIIELEKVLNTLGINLDQLICLGILVGTDYNPGGIKGIGQKKALDIVRKYKQPYLIFQSVEEQMMNLPEEKRFDWQEIYELFHKPDVKDSEIEFPKLDESRVRKILLDREFSLERINSGLERLRETREKQKQKTLF